MSEHTTPIDAATFSSLDTNYQANQQFAGKPIVVCQGDTAIDGSKAYKFQSDWDDETGFIGGMANLLSAPRPEVTHIVIGAWATELYENSSASIVEQLVQNQALLPNLRAIFLGEILQEENEMSWIQQSDISPLFEAFPKLEVLRVRGGEGLSIAKTAHENLRCLAIETGGMDTSVVRSITTSNFPNLEHLELWLGTDAYGGNSSVEDLQPILSGSLFPKLTYLGLKNCDYVDAIAGVVVNSPIVQRLTSLDLSMGVLTDDGANALLSLPANGSVSSLNVNHHFMSDAMTAHIAALPLTVDTGNRQHDDEWRFVSIGE